MGSERERDVDDFMSRAIRSLWDHCISAPIGFMGKLFQAELALKIINGLSY